MVIDCYWTCLPMHLCFAQAHADQFFILLFLICEFSTMNEFAIQSISLFFLPTQIIRDFVPDEKIHRQ